MVLEGDDSVVIQEDLKGEEKIEEDLGIFKIGKFFILSFISIIFTYINIFQI